MHELTLRATSESAQAFPHEPVVKNDVGPPHGTVSGRDVVDNPSI
jgi:hypothetical protein